MNCLFYLKFLFLGFAVFFWPDFMLFWLENEHFCPQTGASHYTWDPLIAVAMFCKLICKNNNNNNCTFFSKMYVHCFFFYKQWNCLVWMTVLKLLFVLCTVLLESIHTAVAALSG